MRRAQGNKVFKLLITMGEKHRIFKERETDRATFEARRWRSERRRRGGVWESCSEDFN